MATRGMSVTCWLAGAVLAATTGTAWADDGAQVARVARDGAVVRAGGAVAFPEIGSLDRGREVIVWDRAGDWAKIELPSNLRVWISAKYVERDGDEGTVSGSRVYLRPGPNTQSAPLGVAEKGERVRVVGAEDGWLQVLPPSGARGWLQASLLEDARAATAADLARLRGENREGAVGKPAAPLATAPTASTAAPALEEARRAFARATRGILGSRDFTAARDALKRCAGATGDVATGVQALEAEVTAAEAEDAEAVQADVARRQRQVEAEKRFNALLKKIQADLEKNQQPAEAKPFDAVGELQPLGLVWNRPGTHRVTTPEGLTIHLRSAGVNLYQTKAYGKRVGIRGQIVDVPGSGLVIEVHEMVCLDRTGK